TPNPRPRLSCGSASTARVRPRRPNTAARLAAVAVLPTPPLLLQIASRIPVALLSTRLPRRRLCRRRAIQWGPCRSAEEMGAGRRVPVGPGRRKRSPGARDAGLPARGFVGSAGQEPSPFPSCQWPAGEAACDLLADVLA